MKKSLFLIAFLISNLLSYSQGVEPKGAPNSSTWYKGGFVVDSMQVLPFRDTIFPPTYAVSLRKTGGIVIKSSNGFPYYYNGTKWVGFQVGASVDTTSLSNRIDLRVKYTDTSAMLVPYLRKIDTTAMLTPYLHEVDTTAMLVPYLRKIDTTAMLANYLTGINARVKYTDTTAMLANYLTGINARVKYIDTAAMLSPYLRTVNATSGTVTSVATGLGLSGGTITTSGTLLVDTASTSILSRQRAATTYAPISINGTVTSFGKTDGLGIVSSVSNPTTTPNHTIAVDTSDISILSRQRAANTYAPISINGTVTSVTSANGDATVATTTTTPVITIVSAPKLTTARTIAGVSFDGTANINLNNNAITNGAGYTTNTGTVTNVSSADANITVATGSTTPVLTLVQTPALKSATTTISIGTATAPIAGQVLTSLNSTSASWQTPVTGTVTNVAALTLGTTGTDLSSSVANSTTTPVITLNVPTASASNRGALSSTDWTTFNTKEPAITSGTTSQYWRGDKTFQTIPYSDISGTPSLAGYVTSVGATSPIASSGGATPTISITNSAADGSTKGAASFTAADFDASSGNIRLDYTNGQMATGLVNGFLSSTDWTTFNGKQAAGAYITSLTGDGTASGAGAAALTLATVNSNVGSFGSSTSIPSFTVNGKGLITAASGNVVIAPAGTLTGATLASGVTASSLTSLGTIGTGIWQGTVISPTFGGTGINNGTRALTINTNGGTLTFGAASKTLTVNNSIGLTGTDATTMTFPTTSATIARTDAAQTFTGVQTFTAPVLGTPTTLVGTNITGTAASLTAGTATVANGLKSATTTVAVSSATAPTVGQVLTATGTTAATWQTPSGGGPSLYLYPTAALTSTATYIKDQAATNSTLKLSTTTVSVVGTSATVGDALLVTNTTPTTKFRVGNNGEIEIGENSLGTTQTTGSITQTGGTNVGVAIVPKGTGAFTLAIPNGSISGGDSRGTYAVDMQMLRTASTQVASGNKSTISGGQYNTASQGFGVVAGGSHNTNGGASAMVLGGEENSTTGSYAIVGGTYCQANGNYSVATGIYSTTSASNSVSMGQFATCTGPGAGAYGYGAKGYLRGMVARSGGSTTAANYSDNQSSQFTMAKGITGIAITALDLGSNAGDKAILTAHPGGSDKIWNAIIQLVGVCKTKGNGTTSVGDVYSGFYKVTIKLVSGVTSLVGAVQLIGTDESDATMATSVVTITADNTNSALKVEFTPPTTAGTTTVINVSANVQLAEVGY